MAGNLVPFPNQDPDCSPDLGRQRLSCRRRHLNAILEKSREERGDGALALGRNEMRMIGSGDMLVPAGP